MGYRNYVSRMKREHLAKLLLLTPSGDEYSKEYSAFRHKNTEQLHEIGKYYTQKEDDNWKVNHDLSDCDTEYYIMDSKKALLSIIRQFEGMHIAYLEKMLKSEDELTEEEKANIEIGFESRDTPQQYAESQLREWKRNMVLNLRDDQPHEVSSSWSYQYTIFNLVHLYKTFDDEEYCLIYEGY